MPSTRRPLPQKLLIGYATDCNEGVANAVRQGVNVVVWSFMEIKNDGDGVVITGNSLDFECIRQMITSLDKEGFDDTVHLVSFGGWNGPHLETSINSDDWYNIWKNSVGDIFHGIDWDLEGHDQLDSPTNVFSLDCLEKMGSISQIAKDDGYIIGLAPPQSYLDVQRSTFSRRVNLTHPERPWHADFHYFGKNVYAYLIAKYGSYIDFVSIQFYESYSGAAMSLYHDGMSQERYLESYVNQLLVNDESFHVNFADDPLLKFSSRRVSLPLSKLVFGFANGWALNNDVGIDNKVAFFEPSNIETAYRRLEKAKSAPRGFMFWVIGEEGTNGVYYAKELAKILKARETGSIKARSKDTEL